MMNLMHMMKYQCGRSDDDVMIMSLMIFFQDAHEDDWYNKSLTALRMNNTHHGLSNPVLQYQA